jgi:hypothetical protein
MKWCLFVAIYVSSTGVIGQGAAPGTDTEAVRIARIEGDLRAIDAGGTDASERQSIAERMKTLGVPGLSVAVFDGGRIIWSRG